MAKPTPKTVARKLLDMHVAQEMKALDAEPLGKWLEVELPQLWQAFDQVKLSDFVSPETVIAAIRRNAIEPEIPGAVAEIAGEAAASLFTAEFHLNTTAGEIISTRQVTEFIDKGLELKEQREALVAKVIHQPIYSQLVSDLMYRGIVRYIYDENVLSKKIPGVSSMLKFSTRMVNKTVPRLEGAVEENVKAFIADNISVLLRQSQSFLSQALTDEEIKEMCLGVWAALESRQLGDLQSGMDSIDLTEFVVLGYEFWKKFRKSGYFAACFTHVVDQLYGKYGSEPVSVLLNDFAIDQAFVQREFNAFGPDIIKTLKDTGLIEALVRRRLEGFYAQPEVEALLGTLADPR
jgi:hypothetical protein